MRPIDEFSYIKQNKISADNISLTQLYLPIIGQEAKLLYDYFVAFFDNGNSRHKFSEILNHLQMDMPHFEEALSRLTAIDLATFYQTSAGGYLVQLHVPLSNDLFLQNPVYRRLLEQEIGDVAVKELEVILPKGARNISKTFSEVFVSDGVSLKRPVRTKVNFDLDSFQRLMMRDGLRFKDDKEDVIALYALSERFHLNWFDTYQLAKETAISGSISTKRMLTRRQQNQSNSGSDDFDKKEQVIIREAKEASARDFLVKIKESRHAVVTRSEEKMLEELANMNFLDEVINVMVLYTLSKTKSANVNKPYIMKLANDFAYQKVTSAEEAVLKMRSFSERQHQAKSKTAKPKKTNVPEWTEKAYKQEATAEESAKLEELKRSMLED